MSRWFRFYADALRNPKVLRLSDKDFRLWVRLLAIASENDGKIAPVADLKLVLAMRLDHVEGGLQRLISGGLIDALDTGFEPHGWAKFQYKSDVSTDRVHKHREKRNVSETPPETETDTEQHTAKADVAARAPKSTKRGARLPVNWEPKPLPAELAAAVARWPAGAIERELARFRDWAASATGPNAVKSDWDAAWRNWLRKAEDEGRYRNDRQHSSNSRPTTRELGLRFAASQSSGNGVSDDRLPRLGAPGGHG